jgi:hypothetical protein
MLNKILVCIQLLLFAACNPSPIAEQNISENADEEKKIRQVYENYKSTVSAAKGKETAQVISSNTIRYYSSLLDMVNNADSNKLETSDLLFKFSVLAIRHSVNWGLLRAMDGEKLFKYAIENGMIGREAVKTEIGIIKFENENHATGELLINNKPTGMLSDFFKESGKWKVDLMAVLKANERGLKKMTQRPNLTENQCIMKILSETFGIEPGLEVWQPANTNAK